ncbi:MAG TPA: peptidoglycan DD-metalloendopeptidase family protein [Terriglobia bacterium]|nr:peptidoglycan DD-metalloendopeptidase family protein [Terriglobia bacterium]
MFKKLFSSLRLKNSWNYKNHRWVLFINIACALLAFSGAVSHFRSRVNEIPLTKTAVVLPAPVPSHSLIERFEGHIKKNMTLGDVLTAYDLPQEMVQQLVAVTKPIYNLKKLIVGNRFELEKLPDGTLKMFSYAVNLDKYVEVSLTDQGYKAEMKPFEYAARRELIAGTIRSSLFQTLNEMNEGDELAVELAEAFSYDIDFNTELQPGDHFKVAVEKQHRDGEFVKYGKILAAEFSNKGKVYSAFRFTDSEGRSEFYDAAGRALRRDLLKSPLKFSRVSSKFSRRRFHPVLGVFRPHLGVDYSAPTGTPIYAAGSGRVAVAGWKNGFGRFIQIQHGSEFSTMYGHLSRFAAGIQAGEKVQQGQLIGYVGATGLATGPHLDYRITRKGVFVNPLGVKFQPSVPLKAEYRQAFEVTKQEWQGQLVRLDFASPQQMLVMNTRTPSVAATPETAH